MTAFLSNVVTSVDSTWISSSFAEMSYVSGQSSPSRLFVPAGSNADRTALFCVASTNGSTARPGRFPTRAETCFSQKPGGIVNLT